MDRTRILLGILIWLVASGPASAQDHRIVLDGSLGTAGLLTPDAQGLIRIEQGMGLTRGANLFHSFSQLDVEATHSARFLGAAGIDRVIARVTGGQSRIDGELAVDIEGADLFLLNPHGVIFGAGASLDLTGSFHVGAAHALEFRTGEVFSADPEAPLTLTSEPPGAWLLGPSPGLQTSIEIAGSHLAVPSGMEISLVAREIDIHGPTRDVRDGSGLFAPSGRIDLIAAGDRGRVRFGEEGLVPDGVELGSVSLRFAGLDVSTDLASADPRGAGAISVRARDLEIRAGYAFADNYIDGDSRPVGIDFQVERDLSILAEGDGDEGRSAVTAEVHGAGDGGRIRMSAGRTLDLRGRVYVASGVRGRGIGSGGSLEIDADRTRIAHGAQIRSETFAPGRGGDLSLTSRQLEIEGFDGRSTLLTSISGGTGAAGRLDVQAQEIALRNGGRIESVVQGSGPGGDLAVKAGRVIIEGVSLAESTGPDDDGTRTAGILVRETGTGLAGGGTVEAELIEVRGGGEISRFSSAEGVTGEAGGSLAIRADEIVVSGQQVIASGGQNRIKPAVISSRGRDRDAGALNIRAGRVRVLDGGQITASTGGLGDGGDLTIVAQEIELRGEGVDPEEFGLPADARQLAGIFARSDDRGRGGPIGGDAGSIRLATGRLSVGKGTSVSVATKVRSIGGSLRINAPDDLSDLSDEGARAEWATTSRVELAGGELLATASAQGATGGSIRVHAGALVMAPGSRISALNEATGDAGDIDIDVGRGSVELEHAEISTEARAGAGGSIRIRAGKLVRLEDSAIATSVASGGKDAGNIWIDPELVVLNRSSIRANAFEGEGGNIDIEAGRFVRSAGSVVEASSDLGLDGEISIRSPVEDLADQTVALDTDYLDPGDLLGEGCAGRTRSASLTRVGRKAAALEPGAALAPPAERTQGEEGCARDR